MQFVLQQIWISLEASQICCSGSCKSKLWIPTKAQNWINLSILTWQIDLDFWWILAERKFQYLHLCIICMMFIMCNNGLGRGCGSYRRFIVGTVRFLLTWWEKRRIWTKGFKTLQVNRTNFLSKLSAVESQNFNNSHNTILWSTLSLIFASICLAIPMRSTKRDFFLLRTLKILEGFSLHELLNWRGCPVDK
jgi:hypothetical protein